MITNDQLLSILKKLNSSKNQYSKQVKEAKSKNLPYRNMMGVRDGLIEAIDLLESYKEEE